MKTDTELTPAQLSELDSWIDLHVMQSPQGQAICRSYHADPAAAMQVLEKCATQFDLLGDDHAVCISRAMGSWEVMESDTSKGIRVEASTLPIAICLFARDLFEEDAR